jgi:OmcA/MtrC family decaheme c-type cytochrome
VIEILSAAIDATGLAYVDFRITDAAGEPLDRDGRFTPGAVELRFVLAWLAAAPDGGPGQYTAYTTRVQTSTITGDSATQASVDSGGTFEELDPEDGAYRYTFATSASGADRTRTHTIGAFGTRTAGEERYPATATFDFVPDGSAVVSTREVVADAACNRCHGETSAHGGSRRGTALCVLCHTPQTTDPDTRNTVDFKVMIHKIHRGEHLPSVEAGTPYQIVGFMGSIHDYSTVAFPQLIERCVVCHEGEDAEVHLTRQSREVCSSCHDLTSFVDPPPAGMTLHSGLERADDSMCSVCHGAGSIAAIADVHLNPLLDPENPRVELEIVGIRDTARGQEPTVRFRVRVSGSPRDILASPLSALRATIAGPNTDFARQWQATVQGTGATGTLAAVDATAGEFEYTFAAAGAIPLDATGSYTVGLEGSLQPTGLPRFSAFSPVHAFAVTDPTPAPREPIVASEKCNSCHYQLSFHGGSRQNPNYCVMCHRPGNANDERVARFEDEEAFVETVSFRVMIHKIHASEHRTQPYVLGGFPAPTEANPAGTPEDFSELRFPRSTAECTACHLDGTYELPLEGRLPSLFEIRACTEPVDEDADEYCDGAYWMVSQTILVPPETSVCTSCHDSPAAGAHAEIMTSALGIESCAVCHGPGSAYDVARVHRLEP